MLNADGYGESGVFKQNLRNNGAGKGSKVTLKHVLCLTFNSNCVSLWGSRNRDQERIIQVSPGAERSLALRFISPPGLTLLGPIATRHVSAQFNPE